MKECIKNRMKIEIKEWENNYNKRKEKVKTGVSIKKRKSRKEDWRESERDKWRRNY